MDTGKDKHSCAQHMGEDCRCTICGRVNPGFEPDDGGESEGIEAAHNCIEHLDGDCKCRICGRVCHDIETDDNGYAASGRIATVWCRRCGFKERYYADTGTIVERDHTPEEYR